MSELFLTHYAWIKAFHIISVISWMAGMLYLPRLYVYHASATKGSELSETLKVMEYRLLRIIINPAMIAAWCFGLAMLWANPAYLTQGWLHVKLTMLTLMQAFHAFLATSRKAFANDTNKHSPAFWRKANEIPTILMIVIVVIAVVKPF